jgi:hypothetical protein
VATNDPARRSRGPTPIQESLALAMEQIIGRARRAGTPEFLVPIVVASDLAQVPAEAIRDAIASGEVRVEIIIVKV